MTLLVIDPYLVHAYWELDSSQHGAAAEAMLRVYDTTAGAANHFDIPVSLPARSRYINLWTPERSYFAELGVVDESGFRPLACSNTVRTPRAWPVIAPESPPLDGAQIEPFDAVPPAPVAENPAIEPTSNALAAENGEREEPVPGASETVAYASVPVPAPSPVTVSNQETRYVGETPSTPEPTMQAEPPGPPEIVDAARILRARLEEIYALLPWKPRPRPVEISTAANPRGPSAAMRGRAGDLTKFAEEHFLPGISSKTTDPPA